MMSEFRQLSLKRPLSLSRTESSNRPFGPTRARRAIAAPLLLALPVFACLFASGCGGAEDGINSASLPEDRPDVTPERLARGRVTLPATEPFNLTAFESNQDGDGRGQSKAEGTGGATCKAASGTTGSAKASFLLGYTFDNLSGRDIDAVIKLKLAHDEAIDLSPGTTPPDQTPPGGASNLAFVIKDSAGVVLKNEGLAASVADKGPAASSGSHDLSFDVRFEPGRGYYLIIAGRCEAKAGSGRGATVEVAIHDVSLDIDWKPAPAAAGGRTPAAPPPAPGTAP